MSQSVCPDLLDPGIIVQVYRIAGALVDALCVAGLSTHRMLDSPGLLSNPDRVTAAVMTEDLLGIVATIIGEADSSGRLARVRVRWDGPYGEKCRMGAEDVAETFADWDQLAREIIQDRRRVSCPSI